MLVIRHILYFLIAAVVCLPAALFAAEDNEIVLASTTSTQASGLYDYLLPKFTADTGITVHVVAVGTGRAIQLASRGDADVLLVHHRPSEEKFVADGFGVKRHDLMHNTYLLTGPPPPQAGISTPLNDIGEWLQVIEENKWLFISRGDNSGTHKKELALWQAAGIDPRPHSGDWYRETGAGMGATLNTAVALNAITLTDRGSWLSFKNRGDFQVLREGDESLKNPYSVILVNPERFAHIKAKAGQVFIDWLLSDTGQQAIGDFRVNGEVLFVPNAR